VNGKQVRFRKIAVVMRLFLGAHGIGAVRGLIPKAGFLRNAATGFDDADVALDFVFEGLGKIAERVEIFYFDLGAELLRAAAANADVGVAAQRAFLHVDVADAGVEKNLAQRGEVRVGFIWRAHVRFGNDFTERSAAAVEIHVGFYVGVRKAVVERFAGVFLEMQPGDPDAFFFAVDFDFEPAAGGQRQFELRDLIALGQIGIKIIFAGEAGVLVNGAVDGERGAHGHFDRALVENRESAGQAEANRADVGIGRIAETRGTAAENFRFGGELDVDF